MAVSGASANANVSGADAVELSGLTPASSAKLRGSLSQVKRSLMLSTKLETLRDMSHENYIEPSQLTKIQTIGGGAFASVDISTYKSPHGSEVVVAVKRLRPSILHDRKELAAFVEEAKLLRKLSHSHITRYIGVGSNLENVSLLNDHDAQRVLDSTFIVQEYIDGGTLRSQLLSQMQTNHLRKRHFSQEQGLAWMAQVAKGLKYLHSARPMVVWRDGKLENILMRKVDGRLEAVIADFGLSTLLPRVDLSTSLESRQSIRDHKPTGDVKLDDLTRKVDDILQGQEEAIESPELGHDDKSAHAGSFDLTGQTGSYFYMAPEVTNSEPYNEKIDVFSFGVLVYEVMTGTITSQMIVGPTGDHLAAEVYALKVAGGYRQPLPKTLSPELKAIISDCWAQQPIDRPSMATVLQRLLDVQQSAGSVDGTQHTGKGAPKPAGGCCGCSIA